MDRKANPRNVAAGPNVLSMPSIPATPAAPIVHLTRLLMAVALAPCPGHRSATSAVLIANTALDVDAITNCSARGTAIHPGRDTSGDCVTGSKVKP